MKAVRALFVRLAGLFRRKRQETEMNEELRAHLDALIERNVAAGMSPEEARFATLRAFGGVEQIKERARDERRSMWAEQVLQDLRYAARQLRKSPGFTLVAVLSLALGIGVNTANFSLINARLLKSLPVKNPDELVLFQYTPGPRGSVLRSVVSDIEGAQTLPISTLERFREESTVLRDVFAVAGEWAMNVNIDGRTELVNIGQLVSGNYHQALGISAVLGRTLVPGDDQPSAPPVVVISHSYWSTRFAADPAVLGKSIMVNRTPVTIVGVTPPDFAGTLLGVGVVDITLPLALAPRVRANGADVWKPSHAWLRVMGRLNPGVTSKQARVALESRFQASMQEALADPNDRPLLRVDPAGTGQTAGTRKQQRDFLVVVTGIVGLVLLTACANVANLLLARGAARRREIAVRMALGASRGRVIRQLLAENMLLALLGAAGGLLVAMWSIGLLSASLALDWRVLGFTASLSVLSGIAFGLAPALRATRTDLTAEFCGGNRGIHGGRSRLRRGLLVGQVAVSFVLLVGAGLFAGTLRNLRAVDVGFRGQHLLLFSIDAAAAGYPKEQFVRIHQSISERIAGMPGVQAVGFSAWPLLRNHGGWWRGFSVPGGAKGTVAVNTVSPGLFDALEMPILFGRGFTPHDDAKAPAVVVVNESFARERLQDENPVGRHFRLDGRTWEVVGVARNVKLRNLRETTPPLVFIPFLQQNFGNAHYAIRTAGDPAAMSGAVRKAVAEVDGNAMLVGLRTQQQTVEGILGKERFFARVSIALGLLALALACVGLYGLLSYLVTQRTGEIGIRMALGALPRRIVGLMLRESSALVVTGVVLGLAIAVAGTRGIATMLYGLSPTDPFTYGAVGLLLIAVALLACVLPARRAAKIDPMVALRAE